MMMFRNADHPIAHDKAAVHFFLFQTVAQMITMREPLRAQRVVPWGNPKVPYGAPPEAKARLEERRTEAKRIKARHYGNPASGLWTLPHAVSLQNPFATACGLPYLGGMQVPSIWEGSPDEYVETHWFELLSIRAKCLGCAGAIGADPTI